MEDKVKVTVLMGNQPVEVPLNEHRFFTDPEIEWEREVEAKPLTVSPQELWDFIHSVESGSITLKPARPMGSFYESIKGPICPPQNVYAGNVVYKASNGWEVWVYNDCNQWDYFESFVLPDGREVHFLQLPEDLASYQPSEEIAWKRYGIPGYLKYRCEVCGEEISREGLKLPGPDAPVLCRAHR